MTTVETPRLIAATITAGAALTAGKHTPVDATAGPITVTLPTLVTPGAHLSVEKADGSSNTVTVSGTIRGTTSTTVLTLKGSSVTFVAENSGTSWTPTAGRMPETSLAAAYPAKGTVARAVTVGFTGDSITDAQTSVASGGLPDRAGYGIAAFGAKSIPGWTLLASQGAYTYGGVWATFGYTAAQIRATHLPSVLAAHPDMCVVLAGTNKGTSLAQDIADLTAIWTTLQNSGIRPVLATLPPYGTGTLTDGSPTTIRNSFIRRYAHQHRLPLVDYYNVLVDPTTGLYQTAYDSGDGTHPSALGAQAMGAALASVLLNPAAANAVDLATANPGATDLLIGNPLMLDATGGVPTNWGALNALGTSTITNPAGPTGVTGNVLTITRGDTDMNVVGSNVTLTAGHVYEFAFKLRVTLGASSWWEFRLENASTGAQYLWQYDLEVGTGSSFSTIQFEMLAPTLANGYSYRPRIVVLGATSKFELAQFSLRDLTALGLA